MYVICVGLKRETGDQLIHLDGGKSFAGKTKKIGEKRERETSGLETNRCCFPSHLSNTEKNHCHGLWPRQ